MKKLRVIQPSTNPTITVILHLSVYDHLEIVSCVLLSLRYFEIEKHSIAVLNNLDNSRWPPPSCHFPDWMKDVTWRDLIGRYRYNVDEHGEKLFKSFRNSSKDQISTLFRCRHITTNARHLSTDADEFIINTFATNNW